MYSKFARLLQHLKNSQLIPYINIAKGKNYMIISVGNILDKSLIAIPGLKKKVPSKLGKQGAFCSLIIIYQNLTTT